MEASAGSASQRAPQGLLDAFRRCLQLLAAQLTLAGAPPAPPPPAPAAPWAAAAAEAAADAAAPDTDAGPSASADAYRAWSAAGGLMSSGPLASDALTATRDVDSASWQQTGAGAGAADMRSRTASDASLVGGGGGGGGEGVAGRRQGGLSGTGGTDEPGRGGEADMALGETEAAAVWGALAGDLDALAGRPSREKLTVAVRRLLEAGDVVRSSQLRSWTCRVDSLLGMLVSSQGPRAGCRWPATRPLQLMCCLPIFLLLFC